MSSTIIVEEFSIIRNGICPNLEIIQHNKTGFFNITKIAKCIGDLDTNEIISKNKFNRIYNWFENNSTKLLMNECKKITGLDEVRYELARGSPKRFAGTYVHRLLYDPFMMWLSPIYALRAAAILEAYHKHVIEKIVVTISICKSTNCKSIIYNDSYQGYCLECFRIEYPNDELVRNYRVKEKTIISDIGCKYRDIICNKRIGDNGCILRPDGLIKLESHNIIIEIDEHQHKAKGYTDEHGRILKIYNAFDCKPLVVIRFNPDGFNGLANGLFSFNSSGMLTIANQEIYQNSINELIKVIDEHHNYLDSMDQIKIIKLRYDHYS